MVLFGNNVTSNFFLIKFDCVMTFPVKEDSAIIFADSIFGVGATVRWSADPHRIGDVALLEMTEYAPLLLRQKMQSFEPGLDFKKTWIPRLGLKIIFPTTLVDVGLLNLQP